MTKITTSDAAQATLNTLLDDKDVLIGRSAKLKSAREAVSYAAHTGDVKAKERLKAINDELLLVNAEMESIDAAIAESARRLDTAKKDDAIAADRANADNSRQSSLALWSSVRLSTTASRILFRPCDVELLGEGP
jgi:hypothetical protein